MRSRFWRMRAMVSSGNEDRVLIAPSVLSADFGRLDGASTGGHRGRSRPDPRGRDGRSVCAQHFVRRGGGGCHQSQHPSAAEHPPDDPGTGQPDVHLHQGRDPTRSWFMRRHAGICIAPWPGVKERGNQVGVAINPGTPVAAVEEVLPLLDIVMVMSVNPGFAGTVVHTGKRGEDSAAS